MLRHRIGLTYEAEAEELSTGPIRYLELKGGMLNGKILDLDEYNRNIVTMAMNGSCY